MFLKFYKNYDERHGYGNIIYRESIDGEK